MYGVGNQGPGRLYSEPNGTLDFRLFSLGVNREDQFNKAKSAPFHDGGEQKLARYQPSGSLPSRCGVSNIFILNV